MDITIDELIIEKDRPKHIAKHDVVVEEVHEIVEGNYVNIPGRNGCFLLIGKTKTRRFLTIIIGPREKKNTYGLVTARPARREEKSFYAEFVLQKGLEND